jgi:hypothetical protein
LLTLQATALCSYVCASLYLQAAATPSQELQCTPIANPTNVTRAASAQHPPVAFGSFIKVAPPTPAPAAYYHTPQGQGAPTPTSEVLSTGPGITPPASAVLAGVLDLKYSHSVACKFYSLYMQKYGNAEGAAHVAALLAAAAAEAAAVMGADGGQQQQLPVPRQLDFQPINSPEVSMHSNLHVWGGGSACLLGCCAEYEMSGVPNVVGSPSKWDNAGSPRPRHECQTCCCS